MNEPNRSQTDQIDSARQQILGLVREIEMFADSKVPPELFYPEYLKRVAMALGADAAAVWLFDDNRQLGVRHFVQRTPLGIFEDQQRLGGYQKPLQDAIQSGGVRVYRPGDPRIEGAPTPHVLIMGALQQGTTPIGVLQILQRTEAPEQARAGYLQFVEQMCNFVARYLRNREQPAATVDAGKELQDLRRVLIELHGSLNVNEVASIAANDGAKFLGCDRVSVVEQYGTRQIVRAVSGQESVNPRSNLVRLMARLAGQVLATGETLRYAGKPEGLAPQIEEPLAEFLDVSRSRLLTVAPVVPREPPVGTQTAKEIEERRRAVKKKPPLGALVIEQVTDSKLRPDFETRLEVLTEHVAQALVNAQEHHTIPLLPVWKFIGKQLAMLRGRRLAQAIAIAIGIALVAAALVFVPWDYRVEGKGTIMPVLRHNIFAPYDGKVVEILVDSGQHVEKGQVLLRLENEELRAKLLATSTELSDQSGQRTELESELRKARPNLSREEVARLQGRITQAEIKAAGAERQLQTLTELQKSLVVHAPTSGVIATFQVAELLANRPVHRGELLLEVMDETGPWRLELEVPEKRLGHILEGQEKLATEHLPVEFVLATKTEQTREGKLETIATRSASSDEGGTVVEVFVSLDAAELPQRRIGAEATAKINCGTRSLGYVLFGDVIEFVRKWLWL